MTFLQDVRFALRSLRRTPGVALAAIATLGLGIGATSAVYSLANGILWRPLPVSEPGRLAVVYAHREGSGYDQLSWADYLDLKAGTGSVFQDVMAYGARSYSLGLPGNAERVWGEVVSANYFSLLGSRPPVGRGFVPAEDSAGAAPAVVLSDALWRSRFGASPAVVGRSLRVNGREFTIVGVAPPGFQSPFYVGYQPALWIAAGSGWSSLSTSRLDQRGEVGVRIMGRLRPGVRLSEAGAVVEGIAARLAELYPATNRGLGSAVFLESAARPEPELAGSMRLGFGLFLALSVVVLLVACANVASLLLARALARRREIAVRLALGAGRGRLIAQLLSEGMVLAVAGGGLGLVLASALLEGLGDLLRLSTDIPFALDFSLDGRVLLYTALVTLATTFAFGLVPALQASSPTAGALKAEGGGWGGVHKSRLRSGLVVAQLCLSCVLLTGAGLVLRSLQHLQQVTPGFDTRNGLLVSVAPGLAGYDEGRSRRILTDLLDRLRALPGAAGATLAQAFPLEFTANGDLIVPEGAEIGASGSAAAPAGFTVIVPEFFSTMGSSLVEGRDFAPGDTVGAPRVAIVSQALARKYWPGRSAVGRVIRIRTADGEALRVVGVAADMKYRRLAEAPQDQVYVPLSQESVSDASIMIRTRSAPAALADQVRREIAALDPALPVADIKTIQELLEGRALFFPRIASRIALVLSLLALVLSLVGLYGIVAYSVAQRSRELGIRLALGATGSGVVNLVLRDGVRLAGLGIGLGLVAAVAVTRVGRSLLYEVSPTDPLVLGLVLGSLALVTLLASWLPARRAARVTPVVALKSD